jgi:energy-coupling factor transporter ATP-binding protein EcfA2
MSAGVPALLRLDAVRWITPGDAGDARTVLESVDLEIGAGESVGIVGRSGAGKTTLLTIAAGLLEPTAGNVAGPAGGPPSPGEIGLVFQEPERGFFEETVLADVAFGPRNVGASEAGAAEAAREALRTVGLPPELFAGRAPETLSGGEARRAAIAAVLALGPRVLFFDEPTTGLDEDGVDRFRAVLAELRKAGRTYVVVSHDLELLAEECERLLVLDGGRIAFDGRIAELPEGLPPEWRDDPAAWGGELAVVASAMRARGWIERDTPARPDVLARAWVVP